MNKSDALNKKAAPNNEPDYFRMLGTVKWFNIKKGYGFVRNVHLKRDIFVHHTNIINKNPYDGVKSLDEDEVIEFNLISRNERLRAVNVTGPEGSPVKGSRYARYRTRYFYSSKIPDNGSTFRLGLGYCYPSMWVDACNGNYARTYDVWYPAMVNYPRLRNNTQSNYFEFVEVDANPYLTQETTKHFPQDIYITPDSAIRMVNSYGNIYSLRKGTNTIIENDVFQFREEKNANKTQAAANSSKDDDMLLRHNIITNFNENKYPYRETASINNHSSTQSWNIEKDFSGTGGKDKSLYPNLSQKIPLKETILCNMNYINKPCRV